MLGIDLGLWPILIMLGLIVVILIWALIKEDYSGPWDNNQEEDE